MRVEIQTLLDLSTEHCPESAHTEKLRERPATDKKKEARVETASSTDLQCDASIGIEKERKILRRATPH